MSKRVLVVISVVLALFMLIGCGGTSSSGAGSTGSGSPNSNSSESGSTNSGSSGSGSANSGSSGTAAKGPERSRTVRIGATVPSHLDPHGVTGMGDMIAHSANYETLIMSNLTDPDAGFYKPYLAERWDVDPAGMYWVFYLRHGITFSNGYPFNADDVVYTINRILDHRDELVWFGQNGTDLKSAEKIDDYTVRVDFMKPFPLAGNSFRILPIISKTAHEKYGDDIFFDPNNECYALGTGPWIVAEWIDAQYIRYKKNENYWNKAEYDSYFNELYYVRLSEQFSGVSAHIAGDLDAYFPAGGVSTDFLGMYAGTEDRIGMYRAEGNGLYWIAFNFTGDSVFHDDNVRHALDLAIDRRALAQSLWPGVDIEPLISHGFFNESTIGYDPTIPKPEYNPDKARELMAQSSYDGRVLNMLTAGTSATWEQMAMAIQDWLGSVGIKVEATLDSGATFFAAIANGNYDILLTQISFPDGIPFRQLNRIVTNLDKQNYYNEELYSYINGFLSEIDDEKRVEYVRKANRFISENKAPDIALSYRYTVYPMNHGLVGIEFGRDTNANPRFVDWDPALVP